MQDKFEWNLGKFSEMLSKLVKFSEFLLFTKI
jgi:hypothetical protein